MRTTRRLGAVLLIPAVLVAQLGMGGGRAWAQRTSVHGQYRSGTRVQGSGGRSVTHTQGPRGGATHYQGYRGSGTTYHGRGYQGGNRTYYQGANRGYYGGNRGYYGGNRGYYQGGTRYYRGGSRGYYTGNRYYYGGRYYGRPGWTSSRVTVYQRPFYGYRGWRTYGPAYYGLVPGLRVYTGLAFLSTGLLVGSYLAQQGTVYVYVVQRDGHDVEYRVDSVGNILSVRALD